MKQDPFRNAAAGPLGTGEELGQPLKLVGAKGWFSLAALALLLGAGLLWAVTASVPIRVSGRGILLPSGGLKTLCAPCDGVVSRVFAQEGARVAPGQCIAKIEASQGERGRHDISGSCSGYLVSVEVQRGDPVKLGDVLFTLEPDDAKNMKLRAVLYFQPADGQRIQPGMSAQLDPVSVDKEDYGSMRGRVAHVSEFPVTTKQIARLLRNADLARGLSARGPPIQVFVDLMTDTNTPTGYSWSSRTGPDVTIHAGTVCDGEVILSEQKPIDLMLPSRRRADTQGKGP